MQESYTLKEFAEAEQRILKYLAPPTLTVNDFPQCYFIVGQPGAGKSTLANIFTGYLGGDVVFISGDDYRKYHPHYMELQKEYGDAAVLRTQKFAGAMTEALIGDVSDKKYNLIIEGTLRTVEVPVNTKKLLERKGYESTLAAILVRPEISYLSTIKRYAMMKEFGTVPRQTPKEHHDLVVSSIIKNLDTIFTNRFFDNIQIYTRESKRIYDSHEKPYINPAKIFSDEFSRPLSLAEQEIIVQDYKEYVPKQDIVEIIEQYKKKSQTFLIKHEQEHSFSR